MEKQQSQHDNVDAAMRNLIEEARVILPGIQALFGFQTISVFNQRFDELATYAKVCHMLGLAMVIVSVAMVMTPAVYYRSMDGKANPRMASTSSWMIRGAVAPLAAGLALDMFTVIDVATGVLWVSIAAGVATFVLLTGLWFVLPASRRRLQSNSSAAADRVM
jgi:hypothetical protein